MRRKTARHTRGQPKKKAKDKAFVNKKITGRRRRSRDTGSVVNRYVHARYNYPRKRQKAKTNTKKNSQEETGADSIESQSSCTVGVAVC